MACDFMSKDNARLRRETRPFFCLALYADMRISAWAGWLMVCILYTLLVFTFYFWPQPIVMAASIVVRY